MTKATMSYHTPADFGHCHTACSEPTTAELVDFRERALSAVPSYLRGHFALGAERLASMLEKNRRHPAQLTRDERVRTFGPEDEGSILLAVGDASPFAPEPAATTMGPSWLLDSISSQYEDLSPRSRQRVAFDRLAGTSGFERKETLSRHIPFATGALLYGDTRKALVDVGGFPAFGTILFDSRMDEELDPPVFVTIGPLPMSEAHLHSHRRVARG